VPNIPEVLNGSFVIKAVDENSKFNLNSLRNADSVKVFKRLLGNLGLDELIAERVADWLDPDSDPRLRILKREPRMHLWTVWMNCCS